MPKQRQLAAIMFTDIVGFTFLMGKDETRGLVVVDANRSIHRECVEANNGHLVKEIGDGMLSWFSSAVDAINCALDIQRKVQEHDYQLRIGIHLGDVVLTEGDVYGNTVNVASRIESLANPGAVFVTEQVVESVSGIDEIKFTFLGEQSLKNVSREVRIFGLEHPQLVSPELKVFLEESIDQDMEQYHLVEKLGVGGMGIIYKALDTRLQRYVALKFLSSQLNRDEKGRERFLNEARAAAGLQHPGICTIYEIDETEEGRFFIAMELVEGPTLGAYLESEGLLSPEQCIELSLQLAEGLQHAHQAGVVHRDIKPENIKFTPEGQVKILDFGLALSGDQKVSQFGSRVGTVAYMSPEQARGELVDHRTDIWSLGVIMYKMLTGRLPFAGDHNHILIQNILNVAPVPVLTETEQDNIPARLVELTGWCLEKDAALRVQTAGDLIAALRRLQRSFSEHDTPSLSRPSFFGKLYRKLATRPWLLPILFLLALLAGWAIGKQPGSEPEISTTTQTLTPSSMTAFTVLGGLSFHPEWSPDGTWIVYVSNEGGSMDLWKKPLTGGRAEQLTTSEGNETDPAWSPDGRSIAFRRNGNEPGLFIIPADGGSPYQLTDFGRSPAWSPDSRQIAFAAYGNVFVVPAAGGEPRILVEGTSSNPRPVWTADGKRILFWHRTMGDIHVVDANGGESDALSLIPSGQEVSSLCVNQKGDRLLFSMGPFGGNKNLYEVAIDTLSSMKMAAPIHLTVTPTDDIEGVYAPDGQHIAFTARMIERHLYRIPLNGQNGLATGEPIQLTRHGKLNYYPEISQDGTRLIWTSHRSGQGNLYSGILGETTVEKVTSEWNTKVREISGRFNPSNGQVIFASTQQGSYQIWRVPSIGSVGLQVTETKHPKRDVHPSVSPDGSAVVFYSNRSGTWDIWQFDLNNNGGTPRQLTNWPGNELYPAWAPDGRSLAFTADRKGNADIWRMPVDNDDAQPFVVSPAEELWSAWSPDQRWFYFVSDRDGNYNIWRTSDQGGEAEQVTAFNDPAFGLSENSIFTKFAVGGDQLILSLESRKGDIYVLEVLGGE